MMTKEEIIDMSRQAGIDIGMWEKLSDNDDVFGYDFCGIHENLEAFVKLIAEKAIKEALEKSVECMCGICKLGHQRTWIGLTQEERLHFLNEILDYGTGFVSPIDAVICNIETKLKYKNTRGQE